MFTSWELAGSPRWFAIGGRQHLLTPLTVGDWAEWEAWLYDRVLATITAGLGQDLSEDERQSVIATARQQAQDMDAASELALAMCRSVAAIHQLLWLSGRRSGMSYEDARRLASEFTAEACAAISEVNRVEELEPLAGQSADGRAAGPRDLAPIYRMLAESYGWTPAQVASLTPIQLIALAGRSRLLSISGPSGRRVVTAGSMAEALRLLRKGRVEHAESGDRSDSRP